MANKTELEFSNEIIDKLAGDTFPTDFAKLYAQHSRLQAGKEGLKSWNDSMFESQLNNVLLLIESAFVQQNENNQKFKDALKRSGEVLEWLAYPKINKNNLPLYLLSAACYQLAEYPARGLGVLNKYDIDSTQSKILQAFLKADFQELIKLLADFYAEQIVVIQQVFTSKMPTEIELQSLILNETVRILGVLYSYFRWGEEVRINIAIKKFEAIEKFMLQGKDSFSWILCKLCNHIIQVYLNTSLIKWVNTLSDTVNDDGKKALNLYIKSNFSVNKTLAWVSQINGIKELAKNESFLLCTPTGSGKTTIAELAIIQSLLSKDIKIEEINDSVALYIVPKRALAAEVEFKLSQILSHKLNTEIRVTSLYGGNDYGPDELSLNEATSPSVIISTQEKTDALIRLLGNDFLKRIKLVVIDEAHNVDLQGEIREGSRELRLETLIARLKVSLDGKTKFIGLSAVAHGIEKTLSKFISSKENPIESDFKSTRQTIGRLYYSQAGSYEQYSDVMDGKVVQLENEETQQPYILGPISNCPFPEKYQKLSIIKKMKPRLFWAAINFAAQKNKNKNKTVLISILSRENISDQYAKEFLEYLENELAAVDIPQYFNNPTESNLVLYNQALAICSDYFGSESTEFKLLTKGIVLHHGKMPGRLGRILVQLVEKNVINIVLANSTLIEGINLPFEIILVPYTSMREEPYSRTNNKLVDIKTFSNLIGRAGRPCLTTEGQTFIVLPLGERSLYFLHKEYNLILRKLFTNQENHPISAIDKLIALLYSKWQEITDEPNSEKFIEWLENTKTAEADSEAIEILDDLDSFLLSITEEFDTFTDLEDLMTKVWEATYACSIENENSSFFQNIIKQRGISLLTNIYPNESDRKFFYKSGLSPKTSMQLNLLYPQIYNILLEGEGYFSFSNNQKIQYILKIVDEFDVIEKLKIKESKDVRTQHLKWWLCPEENPHSGVPSNIYDFISKRFLYIFARNLGSLISIGLFGKEDDKGNQKEKTGLPWIIFWLKDLITWGTLDPVVAYVMANDNTIITRAEAGVIAEQYYDEYNYIDNDDIYNPESIKEWFVTYQISRRTSSFENTRDYIEQIIISKKEINVTLSRALPLYKEPYYRVIPIHKEDKTYWIDVAGYPLAVSERITVNIDKYDYVLDSHNEVVVPSDYLT